MNNWHDVIVCIFIAAMAAGALLLKRFVYPFLFPYLPTWRSAYIAASVLFVALFGALILS
ncbi:hypothetical protein [Neorhizobium alkalisoli]|uniref:hypothetical protein n=1 Tax=Neorhizobium alkalisoli TaxID=528178 RepID=UPI000CF94026|nr:hypothetical protein [Neorhizobium alkalisoli]